MILISSIIKRYDHNLKEIKYEYKNLERNLSEEKEKGREKKKKEWMKRERECSLETIIKNLFY